jgi:hypothetical protein
MEDANGNGVSTLVHPSLATGFPAHVGEELSPAVPDAEVTGGTEGDVNAFLVVYELADVESEDPEEYARLLETLKGYPAHARLTRSSWIVKTRGTPADLLESLDRHLLQADRVFIGALTGEAAWRNVACGFEWLTENLGRSRSGRPGSPP